MPRNRTKLLASTAVVDAYDPADEDRPPLVHMDGPEADKRYERQPTSEITPPRISSRPAAPRGPPPWVDDNDRILTVGEVIGMLGVSVFTLLRMRQRPNADGLPYIQLSPKRIGYRLGDVRAYLRARRVGALTEAAD
jgi:hypothetical protein